MLTRMLRCGALVACLVVAMSAKPAWGAPPWFEAWPSNVVIDPTVPIPGLIGHGASAATVVPDAAINAYLTSVEDNQGATIPTQMQVSPGGGTWQVDSFFDITYTGSSGEFAVDSFFDITYDIGAVSGGPAPSLHAAPSVDFAVDSFFDITYQIDFSDGTYSTIYLHGEPPPGMSLANVYVESFPADSFFDIFFDINSGTAAVSREGLIMRIGMAGDYIVPEPATMGLLAIGGAGLLMRRRKR